MSGIINNAAMYPMLTAEALDELNEVGGEKNLATGYHAIEFLLWGQDETMPGMGAGKRPYTDFVTGGGSTAMNQARRRDLPDRRHRSPHREPRAGAGRLGPQHADNYAAKFGSTI